MSEVDEYLKKVDPAQRKELERIRKIVKKIAPDAEEVISYRVPTFKYNKKPLLYYAAFKNHMSLFPGAPLRLKDKLEGYKLRKGTIQFTVEKPLPESLIKEIVHSRLAEISDD